MCLVNGFNGVLGGHGRTTGSQAFDACNYSVDDRGRDQTAGRVVDQNGRLSWPPLMVFKGQEAMPDRVLLAGTPSHNSQAAG